MYFNEDETEKMTLRFYEKPSDEFYALLDSLSSKSSRWEKSPDGYYRFFRHLKHPRARTLKIEMMKGNQLFYIKFCVYEKPIIWDLIGDCLGKLRKEE